MNCLIHVKVRVLPPAARVFVYIKILRFGVGGHLGGSVIEVMISGSWDRVPHWAPCSVASLLLLL
ncbi:unnamed protein product, partial [Gulo gulo]